MTAKMPTLQVGDRIECVVRGEVARLSSFGTTLTSGATLPMSGAELVSGATVRKLPARKPEVGDKLTCQRFRATQWKRGSIIHAFFREWMLDGEGVWVSVDDASVRRTFDTLTFSADCCEPHIVAVRVVE